MLIHSQKEPHRQTQDEFINQHLGTYYITRTGRPISFEEWAKENNIAVPHVDYGKVFGMAMHNSKTRAQKGKWKAELSRYAAYQTLYERYREEVAEVDFQVLASREQLALIHKRKVRLATGKA